MKSFSRFYSVALFVASGAVLSACGAQTPVNSWNSQAIGQNAVNTNNSGATLQQRCASAPNVEGTGFANTYDRQYRICNGGVVGSSTNSIAIFPEDRTQKQICVFPIRVVNGQSNVIVSNPNAVPSARFVYQCGVISGTGATMNFGSIQAQGGFVVNYGDVSNFANCLATGTLASCAVYNSIGYSVGTW